MPSNQQISEYEDPSSVVVDTHVYRQLIQQLHESSIQRYGVDSEQTRMLEIHLNAHAAVE